MSKYPKRIQEIIDNQGKYIAKTEKLIEKSIKEIDKENKEADAELRKNLGC